jgi:SAM-dependent MidA family methyltransferase
MQAALYEPGLGYYVARASPSGNGQSPSPFDDYQTSPQVNPLFGRLVARELTRVWRALGQPNPFVVVEPGSGDGELGQQLLEGFGELAPSLVVDYHAVDVRFAGGGWPHPAPRLHHHVLSSPAGGRDKIESSWPTLSHLASSGAVPEVHCVVSNEFFDALPVHRLVWTGGAFREVHVDWGGRGFVERLGELSDPALAEWVEAEGAEPEEGWRGEVCLELDRIYSDLARLVRRGVILTIDYGHDAPDSRRGADTLLAYHRHHWNVDWYARVGAQDLTSHVDFSAVLRVGRRHGFEPAGLTIQRAFLLGLGFAEEAERLIRALPRASQQWQTRLALADLVSAAGLGRLKVLAQTRGDVRYCLGGHLG